jgi:hypothetical protein
MEELLYKIFQPLIWLFAALFLGTLAIGTLLALIEIWQYTLTFLFGMLAHYLYSSNKSDEAV